MLIAYLRTWLEARRWRRSTSEPPTVPPDRPARLAILASWINADSPSVEAAFACIATAQELADLIRDKRT